MRAGGPRRVLLVGMMGAGKTTVGRLVAAQLGWPYLDSDAEVERVTGQTVPELFATKGEAAFRRAESTVLADALEVEPVVVAVAGGAVLDEANRSLLKSSGVVVWLRARPDTLGPRVGDGAGRPLLGDDPAASLVALETERSPFYAEVADTVIDVDRLAPPDVVAEVLMALGAQR